jgi:hypothetical protein
MPWQHTPRPNIQHAIKRCQGPLLSHKQRADRQGSRRDAGSCAAWQVLLQGRQISLAEQGQAVLQDMLRFGQPGSQQAGA